jgi:flagellin
MHNNPEQDRFSYDTAVTDVTTSRLGVSGISVASKESAQNNLEMIDQAMEMVSGNRATLGAMQNRLQSSVNNMGIYNENLQNARSRIADVDMASETAELTKQNILSQAGTAVLSQANQNGNLALKLI